MPSRLYCGFDWWQGCNKKYLNRSYKTAQIAAKLVVNSMRVKIEIEEDENDYGVKIHTRDHRNKR